MQTEATTVEQKIEKLKQALKLPDHFSGPKSCFNCFHFKMKVPVIRVAFGGKDGQEPTSRRPMLRFYTDNRGRARGEHDPVARCVLGNLIRGDWSKNNEGNVMEGEYVFSHHRWANIKKGIMDKDWSFANRCSDYKSMLDKKRVRKGGMGDKK